MTKRELLFERVNNTISKNTDAFMFTATIDPDGNLVFNAFFEHSNFDPENPPRSLQAGQALVDSIQAAARESDDEDDDEDEEGNGSVH